MIVIDRVSHLTVGLRPAFVAIVWVAVWVASLFALGISLRVYLAILLVNLILVAWWPTAYYSAIAASAHKEKSNVGMQRGMFVAATVAAIAFTLSLLNLGEKTLTTQFCAVIYVICLATIGLNYHFLANRIMYKTLGKGKSLLLSFVSIMVFPLGVFLYDNQLQSISNHKMK